MQDGWLSPGDAEHPQHEQAIASGDTSSKALNSILQALCKHRAACRTPAQRGAHQSSVHSTAKGEEGGHGVNRCHPASPTVSQEEEQEREQELSPAHQPFASAAMTWALQSLFSLMDVPYLSINYF